MLKLGKEPADVKSVKECSNYIYITRGQSQKDKLFCDLINKLYNVLLRNLFYFHSTKQTNLKEPRSLII
jgi:hypothetical protein